jgi:hypothetical protein
MQIFRFLLRNHNRTQTYFEILLRMWWCWQKTISPLEKVKVEVTLRITVSQSVSQSVWLRVGYPFGAHDRILFFPFFSRKIALFFVLGHPLWREDWSVICSAICQWSESRRTHIHTLLSHLRLLGSLPVASYDSQGLRWKYSYPPRLLKTELLNNVYESSS